MASTYNGILIRANGSDTGTVPRTGDFSGCPDIIPWGQTSVQDPQQTFGSATGSSTSYDQNPGLNINANNVNYIYVRGKNTGTADTTTMTYLWYSPSNLLLWPQQWMTNQYMILPDQKSNPTQYLTMTAQPGAICVVPAPFVWLDPPMPPTGQHYCLITMTGTALQIEEMSTSATQIISADGLGAWIAANGGTGWRNVVTVDTGSPDFTTYINYASGSTVAQINFALICNNVPAGAELSFSAAAPNNGGTGFDPIALPWTTVPGTPGTTVASFNPGMRTNVIANYASGIYYSYKSNGYKTPPGFSVTLQATVISNGNDLLSQHKYVLTDYVPENMLVYHPATQSYFSGLKSYDHDVAAAFAANLDDPFGPPDIGNLTAAVVGSHTTQAPGA